MIVARNGHPHRQVVISRVHKRDLVAQDLENHKSIFAPVRRLPNDVLLYIFQTSIDASVELDVKTIPWLLGYICHHWRALSRSSSSLWTTIFLESECSSYLPLGKHRLRQKLLSLSGSSPLRITVGTFHTYENDIFHRVCPGDDADFILEDINLHSRRWSQIHLIIDGPMPSLQSFPRRLPLLHSLCLILLNCPRVKVWRLSSSASLLRDVYFGGSIVQWRHLHRVVPLSQLTKLAVIIHGPVHADPDFYACVKEAAMLEDLCFAAPRREGRTVQSSAPFDLQLFPTFVHSNIWKLTLGGNIPSILYRCCMPNLMELIVHGKHEDRVTAPEVELADLKVLLHFLSYSECNMRIFHCSKPIPVSTLKSLWER